MTRFRSGELRHRVTLEKPIESSVGDRGQSVYTWTTVTGSSAVPASIEHLNGRELETARQIMPEADCKIIFRWRPNITSDMRVRHSERVYNIGWIDNTELRNRKLICYATEDRTYQGSAFSLGFSNAYD